MGTAPIPNRRDVAAEPEQVLGANFLLKYVIGSNGAPAIFIESAPLSDDNFAGKPEDITLWIGRRPVAAFGNSTGDQQMLQWTNGGGRGRFVVSMKDDWKQIFA